MTPTTTYYFTKSGDNFITQMYEPFGREHLINNRIRQVIPDSVQSLIPYYDSNQCLAIEFLEYPSNLFSKNGVLRYVGHKLIKAETHPVIFEGNRVLLSGSSLKGTIVDVCGSLQKPHACYVKFDNEPLHSFIKVRRFQVDADDFNKFFTPLECNGKNKNLINDTIV